ncbi:MAG: T9SS type A sorting domain-containing protein [Cytophagales bacterium]|nr:T9SS type A sorting domain-containing protein [Cytophagales bacterium]
MTKLTITFVLAIFGYCSLFAQTSGGPDTYGYIWKNSNDISVDAPVYNWIDITTIGTEITGLGDDNVSVIFPFGFTFKYYWSDISGFSVGSNGYIALNTSYVISSGFGDGGFPPTPSVDGKENVVAPFMADLKPDGAGNPSKLYYYSNLIDTLIVSYENVAFWSSAAAPPNDWLGSNTFQVIFAKTDSSITFQYKKQQGSWAPSYDATTYPGVTGIENITEQIGLLVSSTKPDTATAIKFYYPDSVTLSVEDVKPSWTNNAANAGFFEIANRSVNMATNVSNVGNVNVDTAFNTFIEIQRSDFTIAYSDTVSIPSLAQGVDTTIVYPTIYTPDSADIYTIMTFTNLSSDINTLNNQIQTEMVVIDTVGKTQDTLSWDNGMTPGQGVGFEGCGVHFIPPFYPTVVKELLYFIIQTTVDSGGFVAALWDDDGPGGTAGTVLFSDTIIPDSVILGGWNSVNLSAPILINDGGFYISWQFIDTTTQGIGVGVDLIPPFSLRTYEVLSGVWGAYRSAEAEDIMINAVIDLPPYPLIAAISSYVDPTCNGVCNGNAAVNVVGGIPPFTYLWDDSLNQDSVTATKLCAGTYTVTVYDSLGDSTTATLTLSEPAILTGTTTTIGQSTPADTNGVVTVTASGGSGSYSYLWNTGDTTSMVLGVVAGVYSVTVTDIVCGNSIVLTDTVNLLTAIAGFFEEAGNVKIYPNPSTGKLMIELLNIRHTSIALYSILGKRLAEFNNNDKNKQSFYSLDLSNQANGSYFIKIITDHKVITKKIILYK